MQLTRKEGELRSRIAVGFHRLGLVLSLPFFILGVVLGLVQLKYPSGALKSAVPTGVLAFRIGTDSLGDDAKQIIREQQYEGYSLPSGFVLVGLPLGTTEKDGIKWQKLELADGRIIGVSASGLTKTKTIDDIGLKFLLNEKRIGRRYTDDDKIQIDGVPVKFLEFWHGSQTASPPWITRSYDWVWTSLLVGFAIAIYLLMWAIGWVVNGFSRGNSGGAE